MTAVHYEPRAVESSTTQPSAVSSSVSPWLMPVSRSVLFVIFQLLVAGVLYLTSHSHAWVESARWWLLTVIATNIVSVVLLIWLLQTEGKHYLDMLRFSKASVRSDLLWLFGSSIIGVPLMMAPMNTLAT
jgi:hypothetical protein